MWCHESAVQIMPELCRAESEQGFDQRALQEYILICCQQRDGGLCAPIGLS